jgi:O-antigen/teichoic acid export membrane protein
VDTFSYGLGKSMEALAFLALVPVLTRALSPAEFGVFDVSMTFMMLVATAASFALEPAVAAFYFQSQRPEERKSICSTAVWFRLVSSLIVAAFVFGLAPALSGLIFNTRAYAGHIRLVAGIIPCFLFVGIIKQLLRIGFSPFKFNLIAVGHAALYAALAIFLVTAIKMGVAGPLTAALVAGAVFSVIGSIVARNACSFRPSTSSLKGMFLFGLPLAPSLLACWIIDFSDRYFLTQMSTLEQVGVYSVGVKVSSIIVLFITSFQMAWAPVALSAQHEENARKKYAMGMLFFLAVSFAAAAALCIFSKSILMVLAEPRYYDAKLVIFPLTLSAIAYGAYLIVNIGLLITGKTVFASVAIGAAAAVNVLLNYLLIPKFQMIGAAYATLLSYLLAVVLIYVFAQKRYPVPYDLARISEMVFVSLTAMTVGASIEIERSPLIDLVFRVFLLTALLAALFRIFTRRQAYSYEE